MGYSGAGGKLIHKKTRSKKSRDTVPLMADLLLHILLHRLTYDAVKTMQLLTGAE